MRNLASSTAGRLHARQWPAHQSAQRQNPPEERSIGAHSVVSELETLVDAEVSGVAFIRDYVEIYLDGPILRAFARPSVEVGALPRSFPDPGFRDALCSLIGHRVARARETGEELRLSFENGVELRVPLVSGDSGPEAAHLVPTLNGRLNLANMVIWESLPP